MVCQAPPVDGITGKLIEPTMPIFRDSFSPQEAVWVVVDTKFFVEQKKHARLYVTHRAKDDLVDEAELIDASGGYEEFVVTPESNGMIYIKVWETPGVLQDGYDVIVDFPPLGSYDKGEDILDGDIKEGDIIQRGFIVPEQWVCLESISFNHDKEHTNRDAINIRKDYNILIHLEEWKDGKSYPAVYAFQELDKIQIKATFLASSSVEKAEIEAQKINGVLGKI